MRRFPFLSITSIALSAIFLSGCGLDLFSGIAPLPASFCLLILLILIILTIVDVAGSDRPFGDKVAWVAFIVCVPLLSLIIYYLFRKKR